MATETIFSYFPLASCAHAQRIALWGNSLRHEWKHDRRWLIQTPDSHEACFRLHICRSSPFDCIVGSFIDNNVDELHIFCCVSLFLTVWTNNFRNQLAITWISDILWSLTKWRTIAYLIQKLAAWVSSTHWHSGLEWKRGKSVSWLLVWIIPAKLP